MSHADARRSPPTNERGGVTRRAVVIGLSLVVLLSIVVPYTHLVIRGSELSANHLPAGAVMILVFLSAVVNPWLKRRCPRASLSSSELIVVYIIMLVASAIPGRAFLAHVYTVPAGAKYYATPDNKWPTMIHPLLKPWVWTNDEQAVTKLFEGLEPGESIPWLTWAPQIVSWGVFFFLLSMAYLCLSVILRRQWMEAEKLTFPLTQIPLAVVGSDERAGAPGLFRERLMWAGFGAVCALHGLNSLHEYFPFLPSIRLTHILVIGDIKTLPWSAVANTKIFFYPSVVGISYFLGSEVSASLWVFYLFNKFMNLMLAVFGFTDAGRGIWSAHTPLQFFRNQEVGAYFALAAVVFLDLRRRLKAAFRGAASAADMAEVRLLRKAAVGLAATTGLLLIWDALAGMEMLFALLSLIIYYVMGIGIARLVGASGVFFAAWSAEWLPSDALTQLFGPPNLTPATRAQIYMQQALFINDRRTIAMPFFMDSLRLGEVEGLPFRRLAWAMVGSVVVAMAVSSVFGLWLFHQHGAINMREEVGRGIPTWAMNRLKSNLEVTSGPEAGSDTFALGCMGGGAAFMTFLMFMHRTFGWWKLSPVGYLMGRSHALGRIWLSVFIGWLANGLILRYGGLRLYRRLMPFFIGLILGEFFSVVLWLGVDSIIGKALHDFFPSAWPEL